MLTLVLQIVALVCLFFATTAVVPNHPRISWGWAGMFFWLLSLMLGGVILHTTR